MTVGRYRRRDKQPHEKQISTYRSTVPTAGVRLARAALGLDAAELGVDRVEAVLLSDGVLLTGAAAAVLFAPASLYPGK